MAQIEPVPGVKGITRFLADRSIPDSRLHLHVSEVGPGTRAHPPHQHDGVEIFYVLDGTGEVEVEGERFAIQAGEAIRLDCRRLHGLRNAGSGVLRYAVIIARDGQRDGP